MAIKRIARFKMNGASTVADGGDPAAAVLDFWFSPRARDLWFVKNPAFDQEIRTRFIADYERVAKGTLDGWPGTPAGVLSLVILLDQFPRNMFRGYSQAYATDAAALALAEGGLETRYDQLLGIEGRKFLYMPFMHSEDLDHQRRSVQLFLLLEEEDGKSLKSALKHMRIIERFGRFPHRNETLSRLSTPEEEVFLAKPHSGF